MDCVLDEPSVNILLSQSHDMWQAGKHFQARGLQMSFITHKHKSLRCSRRLLNKNLTRNYRKHYQHNLNNHSFYWPLNLTESALVICFSSFIVTKIESDVLEPAFSFPKKTQKLQWYSGIHCPHQHLYIYSDRCLLCVLHSNRASPILISFQCPLHFAVYSD